VLNAIYEEDFLGFSYGFRPGRGAHDALDALMVALKSRKVNFIFDADIRSFFDTVSQKWLIRFLEHRIGDKRIIRVFEVRSYAMARLSFGKPRSLIADRSLGTSAKPWCVWAGRPARSSMFRMMIGRAALSGSLKARRCGRWGPSAHSLKRAGSSIGNGRPKTSTQQWRCKWHGVTGVKCIPTLPRIKIAPFDDKPRAPPKRPNS